MTHFSDSILFLIGNEWRLFNTEKITSWYEWKLWLKNNWRLIWIFIENWLVSKNTPKIQCYSHHLRPVLVWQRFWRLLSMITYHPIETRIGSNSIIDYRYNKVKSHIFEISFRQQDENVPKIWIFHFTHNLILPCKDFPI